MRAVSVHAIRIHRHGGPEVLAYEPVDVSPPGPTEALVRQTAVGLNFIDVYERTGLYAVQLPAILGREGAGVVEAVGSAIKSLKPGTRVAYAGAAGAYAQRRLIEASRLVPLPEGVSDLEAAAVMLKGLTAQMLVRHVFRVARRHTVLIHAAAGGVGSLLVQWAKHLGATVLAVVGSQQKAERAVQLGADAVWLQSDDWVSAVRRASGGRGVHVVYDSVGRDTFMASLDCLRSRGLMVSYGNASGPVDPIAPLELSKRGSLFLTRPTLFHYTAERNSLLRSARELFDLVSRSVLKVQIGQTFALRDTARAHEALESRQTVGATVLLPQD